MIPQNFNGWSLPIIWTTRSETMLMHFFRGTGIGGLTGIPEKKENLIRPLLSFSKIELTNICKDTKICNGWKTVPMPSDDYTRNYFRNQLIPAAASCISGCSAES